MLHLPPGIILLQGMCNNLWQWQLTIILWGRGRGSRRDQISYFIRSTKTFSTFLSRPQRIEISFIYMPYSIRLGMPIIKADSPTSVGKNTSIAGWLSEWMNQYQYMYSPMQAAFSGLWPSPITWIKEPRQQQQQQNQLTANVQYNLIRRVSVLEHRTQTDTNALCGILREL